MLARTVLFAAAFCILTLPVLAHPGNANSAGPLISGLAHPLLGIDHVAAMVAVGLWAAFLGARSLSMVPAAFVFGIAGGFALAIAGISLQLVEPGIAAAVLVPGVLLAAAVRLPPTPSMLLIGLFAVVHGHAHGVELSGGAFAFGIGFTVTTMMLHGAGMGLGHFLTGRRLELARGLGGVAAGIGLALLGGFS